MLIFSWNTDSLREEKWQKLKSYVITNMPDVVCLNETKGNAEKLATLFNELSDYDYLINSHIPAHMHGVAMLIRKGVKWHAVPVTLDCPPRSETKSTDPCCGRVLAIRVECDTNNQIVIVATYVPNAGVDRINPLKNLSYRVDEWDVALYKSLIDLEASYKNVVWIGDINVAPNEIDVSHPKILEKRAGFTPEERESFGNFINGNCSGTSSWIDIWRHQHPNAIEYTFKGYAGHKTKLRLDNCIISASLLPQILDSRIYPDKDFMESDHNPISITIQNGIKEQPSPLKKMIFIKKRLI